MNAIRDLEYFKEKSAKFGKLHPSEQKIKENMERIESLRRIPGYESMNFKIVLKTTELPMKNSDGEKQFAYRQETVASFVNIQMIANTETNYVELHPDTLRLVETHSKKQQAKTNELLKSE